MRHRKDINDLTEEEFKKFAMAVNKLKADGTWQNITMAHIRSGEQIRTHSAGLTQLKSYPSPPPAYGAPAPPAYGPAPSQDGYAEEDVYTVEEEGYEERRNSHNSVIFLPWHRKFLVEVENRLQMALNDCSVTLPYWNWALELVNFENSEIFGADRMGSLNNELGRRVRDIDEFCVKDGAFGAETEGSEFGHGRNELGRNLNNGDGSDCIMRAGRKPTNENYASILTWLLEPEGMSKASRDSESMSLFLERDLHNSFHTAIGGRTGHMGGMASAYDPIFFLHHGFVDYLWKQWQDTHQDSSERFHRRGDLMPRLLWDGQRTTFPAADVSMSMDILDDDASTFESEKACVYYHEREKYHPCAGKWDKIRSCLAKVVKDQRLHEVPRIRELTSVGDVCSPLNPVQADLDRMWLETMSEMGMLEQQEVSNILKWESTLNGQIASSMSTLEEADADQCDKALCFSASKLLEICDEPPPTY
jgi:tyrosinase